MKFGLDKCAYIYIVRGIQKSLGTKLSINGTDIEELDSGQTYTYLRQEEDLEFRIIFPQQSPHSKYLCNSRINSRVRYTGMNETRT